MEIKNNEEQYFDMEEIEERVNKLLDSYYDQIIAAQSRIKILNDYLKTVKDLNDNLVKMSDGYDLLKECSRLIEEKSGDQELVKNKEMVKSIFYDRFKEKKVYEAELKQMDTKLENARIPNPNPTMPKKSPIFDELERFHKEVDELCSPVLGLKLDNSKNEEK